MKKLKSLTFLLLIFFSSLFLVKCSPNTNEIVCDYGTILCDVSQTICTQIPGVPIEVCTYLDLACYNLDQLCALREDKESDKYQSALQNLQTITQKLKDWKQKRTSQ